MNDIEENNNFKSYIKAILEANRHFFRELLQLVMTRQKKPLQLK